MMLHCNESGYLYPFLPYMPTIRRRKLTYFEKKEIDKRRIKKKRNKNIGA
jgi:hypothetical protein